MTYPLDLTEDCVPITVILITCASTLLNFESWIIIIYPDI